MAGSAAIAKVSYEDLYKRWEKGNWRSTELDFSEDRTHWHEVFTDHERAAALWNYSMFFHGEDAVADNLSPFIDAAPREEQKYFLATQQVDEARHAIFFARFMREVVDAGDSVASSLETTRPELTWGFRKVFARLERVADELRRDRSKPKLAAAVALYHLVIEATLAQPGQHFIESYLTERELLPGFRKGMRNISKDEQRHIGFGVKLLSDLVEEDPECRHAVADELREVMPYSVGVFVPPGWDESYVTCFGATIDDVFLQGITSLDSKLRAAGMPVDELPGPPVFPRGLDLKERSQRALRLLRSNVIGEKLAPPDRDPETVGLTIDTIRRSLDTAASNGAPTTIQWDFADADPWYIRVDNGSTSAERGHADSADLVLRCRFEDWTDLMARRERPERLVLTRRLRPKGSPRAIWRMRKLFPR